MSNFSGGDGGGGERDGVTTATSEVVELLERFAAKKQNVKHRLSDIVDDLFGDFVKEVAKIAKSVTSVSHCAQCSASIIYSTNTTNISTVSSLPNDDTPLLSIVNNGQTDIDTTTNTTYHANTHIPIRQPSPSSSSSATIDPNQHLEASLRNAQMRAKEILQDELEYNDKVRRVTTDRTNKNARSSRRRSSGSSLDCEPEITLMPIDKNDANCNEPPHLSASSSTVITNGPRAPSISTPPISHSSQHQQRQPSLFHHQQMKTRRGSSSSSSNNNTRYLPSKSKVEKEEDDAYDENSSEKECECDECYTQQDTQQQPTAQFDKLEKMDVDGAVKSEKEVKLDADVVDDAGLVVDDDAMSDQNGHATPNSAASCGTNSSTKFVSSVKQEPNSTTNEMGASLADGSFLGGEKSLEELNTLCSGLPYAKCGAKYICQFKDCGQELKSRHNLLLHQRAHLGIRPYRCKWPDCNYNSNQSSAVIRHIRTKHFQLPLTMREQAMKNIEDGRDPKEFLEVVATADPITTHSGGGGGTTEDEKTEATGSGSTSSGRVLRASSVSGKSSTKNRRSILMPQLPGKIAPRNGRSSSQHVESESESEDEYDDTDDEDNTAAYDSSIATHPSVASLPQPPQAHQQSEFGGNWRNIVPPLKTPFSGSAAIGSATAQASNNQTAATGYSPSALKFARKRRLEAKIFASARAQQQQQRQQLQQQQQQHFDFAGHRNQQSNGPQPRKTIKTQYGMRASGSVSPLSIGHHHPPSPAASSSAAVLDHFAPNKGQYLFCPEEGCPGIFRTKSELDRHLNDVHNLGSGSGGGGGSSSGSDSSEQYSSVFVCQWPNCLYTTPQRIGAINHVRAMHFNNPNSNFRQPRRTASSNPADYVKLMHMVAK